MAAIAPRRLPALALALFACASFPLHADQAADIRARLAEIATSLASANPSEAMAPFDKSYPNYERLSQYFAGLTVFQIENEVDVTDEEDAAASATVTITWALTLTDLSSNRTDHRTAQINAKLVQTGGKWKIVEFSPINIFNPLPRWNTKVQ